MLLSEKVWTRRSGFDFWQGAGTYKWTDRQYKDGKIGSQLSKLDGYMGGELDR